MLIILFSFYISVDCINLVENPDYPSDTRNYIMIKNIEYTYSTPDGGKQVINNTIPISELIRQQIDLKTYLYYNLLPRGDVEGGAGGEGIEF